MFSNVKNIGKEIDLSTLEVKNYNVQEKKQPNEMSIYKDYNELINQTIDSIEELTGCYDETKRLRHLLAFYNEQYNLLLGRD